MCGHGVENRGGDGFGGCIEAIDTSGDEALESELLAVGHGSLDHAVAVEDEHGRRRQDGVGDAIPLGRRDAEDGAGFGEELDGFAGDEHWRGMAGVDVLEDAVAIDLAVDERDKL